MKISDKTTSPFEKQLLQSARRLREEENYQLPLRKSPRRHQPSITWGASIAAACIGWVVGIAFPLREDTPQSDLAFTQRDTVIQYKEKLVRDTIIQKVEVPVKPVTAATRAPHTELETSSQGCNVECDGIDYDLLIRN